jgi:hypothetical protein
VSERPPAIEGSAKRDSAQKPGSAASASRLVGPAVAVLAIVGAGLVVRFTVQGQPPVATGEPSLAEPIPSVGPSAAPIDGHPRCSAVASDPFILGDAPSHDPDAGEDEPVDAPFAIEVGRGTTWTGGFAVGALRNGDGGTVATVVTLGPEGRDGRSVKLARARGDVDPPVVAGFGDSIVAVMAEPNASGHVLKVAKVKDGAVTWGPELSEGRDESSACDLAIGKDRAVLVWDDPAADGKRSNVVMSTFDPTSLGSVIAARPISSAKVDADAPRVVARPGGFWATWAAHAEEKPAQKGSNDHGAKKHRAESEDDEIERGEAIASSWLEAVPLDESGAPLGAPRAITPKNGHVLTYDLETRADGALVIAWRDDDTPSGSSGGSVSTALVELGRVSEPHLAVDEGVGTGVADLLRGWIAISSLSGPKRMAPLTQGGELAGPLVEEPVVGLGELVAVGPKAMLLATPRGKSMRLSLLHCEQPSADGGER